MLRNSARRSVVGRRCRSSEDVLVDVDVCEKECKLWTCENPKLGCRQQAALSFLHILPMTQAGTPLSFHPVAASHSWSSNAFLPSTGGESGWWSRRAFSAFLDDHPLYLQD